MRILHSLKAYPLKNDEFDLFQESKNKKRGTEKLTNKKIPNRAC